MDWKSLIADLRARGASQVQLAALCGCKQSTVSVLSTGKTTRPSFEIGQALITLHQTKPRELKRLLAGVDTKAV